MKYVSFFTLLVAASSCASVSTLQEPSTVRKGQLKTGTGLAISSYELELDDGTTTEATVPQAVGWARYGITDRVELHTSVWVPLGATIGTKVQLLGDRESAGFVLSPGLDIGYLRISADNASASLVDIYAPLHMGYRTGPSFVVYATPKYLLRYAVGSDGSSSASAISHSGGGTLGIGIGSQGTIFLEATGMYDFSSELTTLTGAIGYQF